MLQWVQRGVSAWPKRARYSRSDMWPLRSWMRMLHWACGSAVSSAAIFLLLSLPLTWQWCVLTCWFSGGDLMCECAFCWVAAADCGSGSSSLSTSLAAVLASSSAMLLPGMPSWPGTHVRCSFAEGCVTAHQQMSKLGFEGYNLLKPPETSPNPPTPQLGPPSWK